MADRKAVIKNADMSEDMQQDAIDCATQALEKYNIEKDIAAFIKKEFDKKYNPTWHCIVGRNFGSYVTHETKHFIYFYLGQVAILLFKSGMCPALIMQPPPSPSLALLGTRHRGGTRCARTISAPALPAHRCRRRHRSAARIVRPAPRATPCFQRHHPNGLPPRVRYRWQVKLTYA